MVQHPPQLMVPRYVALTQIHDKTMTLRHRNFKVLEDMPRWGHVLNNIDVFNHMNRKGPKSKYVTP